jgi:WD40-like Beta Propeller Repeat
MRRAGLAALFFLASGVLRAQGPAADWRTVETKHFRVHYPAPFAAWALHAAGEIEAVHARVTDFVGYVPARRIEVVVADPAADSNGTAVPFLDRPEIFLWTSAPESESGVGDYGDWMELVATHEIAHIVHLARPGRGVPVLRVLLSPAPFGPLALASPEWVTEGYATIVEGALTGSGRPGSSFRAMVLRQLSIEGKLPDYDDLDGSGWLRGSIPYLVGSAYLEWLSDRNGRDALPRLWERMASARWGGFSAAFKDIFGESPNTLYDRFRAELTARALEEEKRIKDAGLVEGELWQRLSGGTLAAQVSPDGTKLLARRDPSRSRSELAVWEIAAAAPAAEPEAPHAPGWTLPRANGQAAADPRWMPGGRDVLFSRRAPVADRTLHRDLYRWTLADGRVARLTHNADVSDADPSPDGAWAVAVRSRFGASALVRVELATGQTREIPARLPAAEAWPVWSHPRVSPDGRRIAALLHSGGAWRLVTLAAEGGEVTTRNLPGAPASAPAWSADGARIFVTSDGSGIWNVVSVDATGAGGEALLTRVTGGAFAPAPTPDGKALFFLDFAARGVAVRRLVLDGPGLSALERPADAYPLLPPAPVAASTFAAAPVSDACPYSVWPTQTIRPLIDFSFGPSGNTVQLGADSADVLGRLHLLAMGSIGNAAGPRGGSVAAAWRGLPVALTLQLFSAIEKPGNQGLAPRPEFDQERWGGYLGAEWARPFAWGRAEAHAGGGSTDVEVLESGRIFGRTLGSAGGSVAWRRTRGGAGFGIDLDADGSIGVTDGSAWTQWAAGGRLIGILPFASLSAGARYGQTGGRPTRFDDFAIGGACSAILPPGLDRNRIQSPALPADLQVGGRFEAYRLELSANAVPVVLYADWARAWNGAGSPRPEPVRVAGAEVRLDRLIPPEFGRTVACRIGGGWIVSDAPHIRALRGYAQLVYRP